MLAGICADVVVHKVTSWEFDRPSLEVLAACNYMT